MNNRGQMATVGALIVLGLTLIVGVVILQASAQNVGEVVNTVAVSNQSTAAIVNGTPVYLTNYRSISDVVIYNVTANALVPATNYTVTNNEVYNGALAVKIVPSTTADLKYTWKVSGTGQPTTYDDSSGGRAVSNLIVIMMAVALVAVGVFYVMKKQV